jgi:hypothetical protein
MENLNNRITTVQHFLELLRLVRKGKSFNTLFDKSHSLWKTLIIKHKYSIEHLSEIIESDREI